MTKVFGSKIVVMVVISLLVLKVVYREEGETIAY